MYNGHGKIDIGRASLKVEMIKRERESEKVKKACKINILSHMSVTRKNNDLV